VVYSCEISWGLIGDFQLLLFFIEIELVLAGRVAELIEVSTINGLGALGVLIGEDVVRPLHALAAADAAVAIFVEVLVQIGLQEGFRVHFVKTLFQEGGGRVRSVLHRS